MAVAGRESRERPGRARASPRGRPDHPVLLVDRLAAHDRPAAGALLEEVVEAAEADDVDLDAVDLRPLRDRHLRLGDRAAAGDVDREAAEQVQDARRRARSPARLTSMNASAGPWNQVAVIQPSSCQTVAKRSQSPASRHSAQFSTTSRIAAAALVASVLIART